MSNEPIQRSIERIAERLERGTMLTDHDLARIRHIVEQSVTEWVGIATFLILQQMETSDMALADTLAQLQTEDTELAADVTALGGALSANTAQIADLQAQIAALVASGTATPEQLAALQTVADDLAATHNAAVALIPPPPAP